MRAHDVTDTRPNSRVNFLLATICLFVLGLMSGCGSSQVDGSIEVSTSSFGATYNDSISREGVTGVVPGTVFDVRVYEHCSNTMDRPLSSCRSNEVTIEEVDIAGNAGVLTVEQLASSDVPGEVDLRFTAIGHGEVTVQIHIRHQRRSRVVERRLRVVAPNGVVLHDCGPDEYVVDGDSSLHLLRAALYDGEPMISNGYTSNTRSSLFRIVPGDALRVVETEAFQGTFRKISAGDFRVETELDIYTGATAYNSERIDGGGDSLSYRSLPVSQVTITTSDDYESRRVAVGEDIRFIADAQGPPRHDLCSTPPIRTEVLTPETCRLSPSDIEDVDNPESFSSEELDNGYQVFRTLEPGACRLRFTMTGLEGNSTTRTVEWEIVP